MMRLFFLFLLFVPALRGVAQEPEFFQVEVDPQRIHKSEERWFGLYVQNHKVGYMQKSSGPVMRDGVEVYQDSMVMHMEHRREGLTMERKVIEHRWFEMEAPFDMIGGETITQGGGEKQVVSLVRTGDLWQLSVEDSSGKRQLETGEIGYSLRDAQAIEAWANLDDLDVNAQIKTRIVDMESGTTKHAILTFLGSDSYLVNGVRMPVRKIAMEKVDEPGRMLMYVDEYNELLWLNIAGIEVRAEPKMAALQLDEAADFLSMTTKSIDKPLGDPKRLLELHVSIDDPNLAKTVQTPRQKVEVLEDGSGVTFSLGQVAGPDLLATEDEIAEALKETPSYPIRAQAVVALAKEAVGDAATSEEKVRALVAFVANYVEDSYVAEPLTVQGILQQKRGDCTEHALLFTTLARALGIPAREVSGFIYSGDLTQSFGGHAWNEVVLDGKWHAVDASWNEFDINPAHIRLAHGPNDQQLDALSAALAKSSFKLERVVYEQGYMPPHVREDKEGGKEVAMGQYGVTVRLPQGWTKGTYSDDLDVEQFHKGGDLFMIVFERISDTNSEEDFAPIIENLKNLGTGNNTISNDHFKLVDGVHWGRATTETTLKGLKLAYRTDTLSRQGVTYQLLSWASVTLRKELFEQMDALVRGISFPEQINLTSQDMMVTKQLKTPAADLSLQFSKKDYLLIEGKQFEESIFCASVDNNFHVTIVVEEWLWENDPEAYMQLTMDFLEAENVQHRVLRQPFKLAGRDGFLSVANATIEGQDRNVYVAVTPIAAEALLVARIIMKPESEQAGWQKVQALLANLTADLHQPYSMPEVAEETAEAPFLNDLYNPYREAAESLFMMPAPDRVVAVDDLFVIANGSQLLLLNDQGLSRELKAYQENISSLSAAMVKDDIFINTNLDKLVVKADGSVEPLAGVLGGIYPHSSEKAVVWQGRASTEAQMLLDLHLTHVKFFDGKPFLKTQATFSEDLHLAGIDHSGEHLLVIYEPTWYQTAEAAYYRSQRLDVNSGKTVVLDLNWREVYRIVPADGGWLVFGQPENRPVGVYQVALNGSTDMLLPGSVFYPIDLRQGRLRFYVKDESNGQMLSLDVEKAKALTAARPMIDPAVADKMARVVFQKLGWQLEQPGLLGKKADLLAFMAAADQVALSEIGSALPKDAESIHTWLQYGYNSGVWWSLEAEVLVTAMLMRGFLEAGATWVDSPMSLVSSFAKRMPDRYSAPLHMGFVVGGIFESTIYSEEGYWQPISEIQEASYGRQLVLCNDYKVMADYISERTPQDMLTMVKEKPKQFNKILNDHPQNTFLFFNVAEQLIELGERDALRKLLKYRKDNWSAFEEHFALILDVDEAAGKPKDLLVRLTTQIEQYPNNAMYRYLLGKTHLRVKGFDAQAAARQSFEQAQELSRETDLVYLKAGEELRKLDQ